MTASKFRRSVQFVKMIESHPMLYDYTTQEYSDKPSLDRAWEEVSQAAGESVEECKARWKNIRNSYSRHMRKKMSSQMTGKLHKPYYLKKHLNFIKKFISFRGVEVNKVNGEDVNITDEIADEESNSNIDSGILKVERRRNSEESVLDYDPEANNSTAEYSFANEKNVFETAFVNTGTTQQRADDADMSFLKSVLPDMKEMNQKQKRRFKMGVLKLCGDILCEAAIG